MVGAPRGQDTEGFALGVGEGEVVERVVGEGDVLEPRSIADARHSARDGDDGNAVVFFVVA